MKGRLISAFALLAAVSTSASAQANAGGDGARWSAMGGLAPFVYHQSTVSKMGSFAEAGVEWKLISAWGIRPNVGYITFPGKTFVNKPQPPSTWPRVNILALGVDLVHRDESKLYFSVGAGYYKVSCEYACQWKPAARVAVGWTIDRKKRISVEAGITNVFVGGPNPTWAPVGIRVAF